MQSTHYVGRFAPSPTGLLHFGSLLAAMASYCDARLNNGAWHLRIDDIDPPRAMPNASELIQQTLTTYGLKWDGPVMLQSERSLHYKAKLTQLNDAQLLFACACSRTTLAQHDIYPGFCNPAAAGSTVSLSDAVKQVRKKLSKGDQNIAIRLSVDSVVWFEDRIQGQQEFENDVLGDTVVVRRDDLYSYALACALDDADGITHVVRGSDLLTTTANQLAIIKRLNLTPPSYAHIPVAVNSDAQKLSKQTLAHPLDDMPVLPTLLAAWQFLGQENVAVDSPEAFWNAATLAWQIDRVPKQSQIASPV